MPHPLNARPARPDSGLDSELSRLSCRSLNSKSLYEFPFHACHIPVWTLDFLCSARADRSLGAADRSLRGVGCLGHGGVCGSWRHFAEWEFQP